MLPPCYPAQKADILSSVALEDRLLETNVSNERLNGDQFIDLSTDIFDEGSIVERSASQASSNIPTENPSPRMSKIPVRSRATFLNELMRADL